VDAETEVRFSDGSAGSRADLRWGVHVAVLGNLAQDGRTFEAGVIVLLPSPGP